MLNLGVFSSSIAAFPSSCVKLVARSLCALLPLFFLLGKFEFLAGFSFPPLFKFNLFIASLGWALPSFVLGWVIVCYYYLFVYVRLSILFIFCLVQIFLCFALCNLLLLFLPCSCLVQSVPCFLLCVPFFYFRICPRILLRPPS